MRHLSVISQARPAEAQFESILQLMGIINGAISIISSMVNVVSQILQIFFGIDTVQK